MGTEGTRPVDELRAVRINKWEAQRALGRDPFRVTRYDRSHTAAAVREGYPANEGQPVRVAGRVTSIRRHGRAAFLDLVDQTGRIQLYAQAEAPEAFSVLDHLDLGDHLGAAGTVFATRRGEVSVLVTELVPLTKSLEGLPDKYHGLQDVDLRYRRRYLDLIANPEVRDTFRLRSEVVRVIREFLSGRGFMEVETPILHPVAGGAEARPFITHHNALDIDLYLRIAIELYLKRLIVGGFEQVYEIGRVFRNEGISPRHLQEFTMLELYWAYVGYEEIMALVEDLLTQVLMTVKGTLRFQVQGEAVDFTPPYARVDLVERLREKTGIDWFELTTRDLALEAARGLGIAIEPASTRTQILDKIVSQTVEPDLRQPTFLLHHPVDISPLAKRRAIDPRTTERFELFCLGREMGNAFSELNDPVDQRERFLRQLAERQAGNEEAPEPDEDFLLALEHGMPPTGGLGLGIDRLMMVVADLPSIRDAVLFPPMRPR
jgi:lysyl-tRNA synthetase class 2